MIISDNLNFLYLSNLQTDYSVWIWIALAMSLISLICSLVALRRSKQKLAPAQIEMPSVRTAPSAAGALDPAIVAVLTAAVAMMLSDTAKTKPAGPGTVHKSHAGFTIRTIRRV